ncbi:hypothetical protein ACRQ1B_13650 [Rhizobium panacihumi]|uniref:hypothetical protein n=1 Tax=Rhizobium panacihumi TaxID=2008450 RepID=UPI003D7B16B9
MNDLVYVGFVLAGAMTLVIEAYRNFNAPNARHPFELHPILKEVEVRNLCTMGEVVGGFIFYALLYLVAYGVVLSSAEVYGLLAQAYSATGEIGAADGGGSISDTTIDDLLTAAPGDYSKPIVVSALLISSLSIGAIKPIELTMRALAHRLAGVPRGVYRVIEHIRLADFGDVMKGHYTALTEEYESTVKGPPTLQDMAITNSLKAVDCLSVVADTDKLSRYFPLRNLERLKPLIDKVETRLTDLKNDVANLVAKNTGPLPAVDLRKMRDDLEIEVRGMRSDLIAVFAVLYIRNDHAVYRQTNRHVEAEDPINRLEERIAEGERQEQNAFGVSILIAFVLSYALATAIYYKWRYWQGVDGNEAYLAAPTEMRPFLKECASKFDLVCESAVLSWRQTEVPAIFAEAAWDQLQSLLVTFFCVLLVILGREVRVEQQSWRREWKFTQFPFLKLLAMSTVSGFAAVFLTALVLVLKYWCNTEFDISRAQLVVFFQQNSRFMLLQVFGGLVLALSALVIMDKHAEEGNTTGFSLMLAAFGSMLYFLFTWASLIISVGYQAGPVAAYVSLTVRDTLILSLLPGFFLFLFAYFLELSEREGKRDKPVAKATVSAPAGVSAGG